MTAIVLAPGIVRATRPLTKRGTSDVFGTEVSIMTEVGKEFGETLKVVVFDRDGRPPVVVNQGARVAWIVEVDAGRFGLSGTFRSVATAEELQSLPAGTPSFDLPAEPAAA